MPITARPVALGSRMPWFDMADLDGRRWRSSDLDPSQPVLLVLMCSHSPYVQHIEPELAGVLSEVTELGVSVVCLAPNDPAAYPTDDVRHLRLQSTRMSLRVPYCIDENQRVAIALGAACTPEFFLFDFPKGHLVFHGQFDSSRPGNAFEPTGDDLRTAVVQTLAHDIVSPKQEPSFGCSIKWADGRPPQYLSVLEQ